MALRKNQWKASAWHTALTMRTLPASARSNTLKCFANRAIYHDDWGGLPVSMAARPWDAGAGTSGFEVEEKWELYNLAEDGESYCKNMQESSKLFTSMGMAEMGR